MLNFSIDKVEEDIYIIGEIEQTKMSAKNITQVLQEEMR